MFHQLEMLAATSTDSFDAREYDRMLESATRTSFGKTFRQQGQLLAKY